MGTAVSPEVSPRGLVRDAFGKIVGVVRPDVGPDTDDVGVSPTGGVTGTLGFVSIGFAESPSAGMLVVAEGRLAGGTVRPGVSTGGMLSAGVAIVLGAAVNPPGAGNDVLDGAFAGPRIPGMLGTTMPNCERLDCSADITSLDRSVTTLACTKSCSSGAG
jgi:hypothetical protein